jgi:glycerol-3-phosphate acyltransferase PlsX
LSVLPKADGSNGILLDVGANADCKPEMLNQFAILGSLYSQHVFKRDNPKVALLSIGAEKEKGNILTLAAHQLLAENKLINFVGNAEGRDLFNDKADVIVCDGFTGNVVLKSCESIFYIMHKRKITDDYFARFNYENYGGTPVLGVNAPVIIGHGISNALAFKNLILQAQDVVESRLVQLIKDAFHSLSSSTTPL